MGYRSSVYFQINPANLDDFRKELEELAEHNDVKMSDVDEFLDMMRQKQFPDKHVYFNDYIKWYTDDAVIRTVEEAVTNLEENTFIRVGEDSDDIEWWDGCPNSEWVRWGAVSCVGTFDALSAGMSFLQDIELGSAQVRQKAIAELEGVLKRLREADGADELPETTDFQEEE